MLEIARGQRSDVDTDVDTLVDLTALEDLATITLADGQVRLGSLVTHSDIIGFEPMRFVGLPLAQACIEVGSPQLRNRATVAGNLVTASPANDTISALYAMGASVTVASAEAGEKNVAISDFITGYRSTILKPDELVTQISFPALHSERRGIFVKLGLRRVQAISVVNASVVASTSAVSSVASSDGNIAENIISDAQCTANKHHRENEHAKAKHIETATNLTLALGSVGPVVILIRLAFEAELGLSLSDNDLLEKVALAVRKSISPVNDLRSTSDYRSQMAEVVVKRALQSLANGTESCTWNESVPRLRLPFKAKKLQEKTQKCDTICCIVSLDNKNESNECKSNERADEESICNANKSELTNADTIVAIVNGVKRQAANSVSNTLLEWLRTELRLTGTKEGCAEGECGSCTVHLNGMAVLACLVPAACAHGAQITTVEGLAVSNLAISDDLHISDELHPVQQALADSGGVQCGFCTPGFVMSAAMLAKETTSPTRYQVEHALSGNLCRCTGYYPIINALTDMNALAKESLEAINEPSETLSHENVR